MSLLARRAPLQMPRGPRGSQNPSSAQVASSGRRAQKQTEELPECPLCIEKFDTTELSFEPCPCGYKICLFCFGRICKEFNNQCPGCRTAYGTKQPSDQNGGQSQSRVTKNAPQRANEQISGSGTAPQSQPRPQSRTQQKHPPQPSRPPLTTWPSLAESTPASGSAPVQPKVRQVPNGSLHGHRKQLDSASSNSEGTRLDSTDSTQTSKLSGGSESRDWPALKSSVGGRPPSRPNGMGSVPGGSGQGSASESLGSTSEGAHQHAQEVKQGTGTITAEVMSTAGGLRRMVCVPIDLSSLPDPPKHPDGVASLGRTRKAVHEGKISSAEGAVRLVSVLNKIDKQAGERPKASELLMSQQQKGHSSNDAPVQPATCQSVKPSIPPGTWAHPSERLDDTPSIVVDGPPTNPSPISPPMFQESVASMTGASPFSCMPGSLSSHIPFQMRSNAPAPQQQSVWTDKGLPGIELLARRSLSTQNAVGRSQHLGSGGLQPGHDIFRMPDQRADQIFNHHGVPLVSQQSPLNNGMLFGGYQHQNQVVGMSMSGDHLLEKTLMPNVQGHHDHLQNGFGPTDMQYPTGPPPGTVPNGHGMLADSIGNMVGSPGMWVGGHTSDIPQYLPPEIAAARGLGSLSQTSSSLQVPGGFQHFGAQPVEQQIGSMRLQDPSQMQAHGVSRLLQNWK